MDSLSNKARLVLSIFHLVLGVLLISGLITKFYSAIIVLFGIIFIIKSKNKNDEAIYWSAYLVGGEVLFRMSGGMIFHELPKYSVLLFLLLGLFVEKKRHHVSVSYLVYILLLLIGIAFVDIPYTESIRKAIAFNLSGPILLGISAIYFYKRELNIAKILDVLFFMLLPIISMLSLLYFKTPDVKDIVFGGVANFKASGGYGPNQVATLLGLGVFIVAIYLFFKQRIFLWLTIDVLLFVYLNYRGLLTFSRGGMFTAFICIGIFTFFFILSQQAILKNMLKYIGIAFLFGIALFLYTSNITDGMLLNRYTNKNAAGIKKEDVSAGRVDLFKTEMEGFYENPFFGLGVGGGKYYRQETTNIGAASHNEVSRLLGEHGMIGVFILILLVTIPCYHILNQPFLAKGFLLAFLLFWFLTINHSAMRIAFPAFIYGLSLIVIERKSIDEEDSVYRE